MIESYSLPNRVEFNPKNKEHVEAFALLLFKGRQHPTLRFSYEPRKYGNAFEMMLHEFVREKLPKETLTRIENLEK